MKITVDEIARLALAMLEGQRLYWKEKDEVQKRTLLIQSKRREKQLREMCEKHFGGTPEDLFGYGGENPNLAAEPEERP
jgi:hypothetical protein